MRAIQFLLAALALVSIAACGGGGGGSTSSGVSFVRAQVSQTSETADPVEINDLDLAFPESTSVFDSLFR
jgi:hypothetical protein